MLPAESVATTFSVLTTLALPGVLQLSAYGADLSVFLRLPLTYNDNVNVSDDSRGYQLTTVAVEDVAWLPAASEARALS